MRGTSMTRGSSSRRRLTTPCYSLRTTYYLLLATCCVGSVLLFVLRTTLATVHYHLPPTLQAANPGELNEWDDELDDFTSEVS